MTTYDPNSLLMGAGGRSAKFEKEGDTVDGTILRMEPRQRTEIGSNAPMFWKDGNPQMQLVIALQTAERFDEDDDGIRNVYVSIPSQMRTAIADGVRRARANGMAVGGRLAVKFVRTEEPKQRGFSGQKIYSSSYEQPTVSVGDDAPPFTDEDLPF
jgi:hypothetical protein